MPLHVRPDHVGITVAPEHLDATLAWYTDKLDFSVVEQFDLGGPTLTFIANGDAKIELLSFGARPGSPAPTTLEATHDIEHVHHLCLAVDDLDDALALLRERGVVPFAGPTVIEVARKRTAFLTDPVGSIVELIAPA
jgi:catechol 2,3-dioxygenase-like lactoylglutathione lyase family enzyme